MDDFNQGLQGKDLQRAYWYNTHQSQVRRVAYGIAIGIVGVIWLINAVIFIRYLMNRGATQRAVEDLANTQVIYDSIQAPVDLIVDSVDAVSHTADTVDAFAIVSNPNRYHVAHFDYVMSVNGANYSFSDGVIMPNSKSYLVVSALAGTATSPADLTISNVTWERVRGPEIKTQFLTKDLLVQRSNLNSETTHTNTGTLQNGNTNSNVNSANTNANNDNTNFVTPDALNTNTTTEPSGATITQLGGLLTNASAYGFRRVAVTAILKSASGTVLGVQQQVFTNMGSFSDYNLVFNWQRQFDFNVAPEIVVETNIWDDANLILPGQD